jgi:uncharacterized membrane protein YfcA
MELTLLCLFAFLAGFTDAIAGGGGLIQTPAALVLLPQYPLATVLATLKIPSFSGTSIATTQFIRRVSVNWLLVGIMTAIAFCAAFAGSTLLTRVNNSFMKPLLLFMLIIVAIYTFTNKKFGDHTEKGHSLRQQVIYSLLISLVIGFYDGFIGPGAGSFLILSFIGLMGFDFLKASAHAKFVNLATNLGSITFFTLTGKIIFSIALPMAACNALGGLLGARLALLRGNAFIRIFFLMVVCFTIIRFAYDVWFKS